MGLGLVEGMGWELVAGRFRVGVRHRLRVGGIEVGIRHG